MRSNGAADASNHYSLGITLHLGAQSSKLSGIRLSTAPTYPSTVSIHSIWQIPSIRISNRAFLASCLLVQGCRACNWPQRQTWHWIYYGNRRFFKRNKNQFSRTNANHSEHIFISNLYPMNKQIIQPINNNHRNTNSRVEIVKFIHLEVIRAYVVALYSCK